MPIVYAVVARGKTVLAENTVKNTSGNFLTITRVHLLPKVQKHNTKMSLICNKHMFHYIVEDGVTYLCMAEESPKRRIPFAFLTEIKDRFTAAYSRDTIDRAIAFGMNSDFGKVLAQQMAHFNDPRADNMGRVRGQLDEVRDIMIQNIEKVLERGEKFDLLVDKTEQLNNSASRFKKQSKRVSNHMWWKNCRMKLIIVFVLLCLIYFIMALACDGPALSGCFGSSKK